MKNTKHIEIFESWMVAKRMSDNTIKIYIHYVEKFMLWVDEDLSRISKSQIQYYILSIPKNKSNSYRDQNVSAIKLFFKVCKGVELSFDYLPRPKKTKYIPNVLEVDEVQRVIFNTENLKHLVILFVLYDNALRVSELLNLRLLDVRTKCKKPHLIIRDSKNNNTDNVYLSQECLKLIKKYYIAYKPTEYLFEGQKGYLYSKSSIRSVLNRALEREAINKHIRIHDLRHTMAYHLLLNGTNIYHLSKLLRHKSVKTTEDYYSHINNSNLVLKRPELRNELDKIAV